MKRILVLIKGLERGGAERLIVNAAPHLDTVRFHYTFAYVSAKHDALAGELTRLGFRVQCLEGGIWPAWVSRFRRLVKESGIDLVHAHLPLSGVGARLALINCSVPLVYTEHSIWSHYRTLTREANRLTFLQNDHVLAVSDHVRASIRPTGGLGGKTPRVETLIHGIDASWARTGISTEQAKMALGIPVGDPVVGTVANFRTAKGHIPLLNAAQRVRRSLPNCWFIFVGGGHLEATVRRQAARLGLTERVIFTGFQDDVRPYLEAFDVFALASESEGLSVALMEAMAYGKPSVVTSAGGIPEIVTHEQDALLASPGDHEALSLGLLRLLGDKEAREKMGRHAQFRSRKFDIRRAVRRVEELYGHLLQSSEPPKAAPQGGAKPADARESSGVTVPRKP